MALDNKDIFNAIFSRNNDQPIEVIMQEYEKARILNEQIEKRAGKCECSEACEAAAETAAVAVEKKKYTRRMLKVKPEEAIGEDFIKCCICGKEGQVITSRHLVNHGISVADYKRLCRYPAEQSLMSKTRERFAKEMVIRAQQARRAKQDKTISADQFSV